MTAEELSRRNFLKRMAAVGFAVPIVTSFALDGVASAEGHHNRVNQANSNQGSLLGLPNQVWPNQLTKLQGELKGHLLGNQTAPV